LRIARKTVSYVTGQFFGFKENRMFRMTSLFGRSGPCFLMSGTAHAALTADQVWQSWKDAGALVGLTVSAATENNAGGVLTLNGVSIAPEGDPGCHDFRHDPDRGSRTGRLPSFRARYRRGDVGRCGRLGQADA
jgi:hypothetical protein